MTLVHLGFLPVPSMPRERSEAKLAIQGGWERVYRQVAQLAESPVVEPLRIALSQSNPGNREGIDP